MPEDYVCNECGFTQDVAREEESCPFCGGRFVNLNDDVSVMDDRFGQDEESDEFGVSGELSEAA